MIKNKTKLKIGLKNKKTINKMQWYKQKWKRE